jgi:hypothetical protein
MKELIRIKDRPKSSKKQSLTFKHKEARNTQNPEGEILDKLERVTESLERATVP